MFQHLAWIYLAFSLQFWGRGNTVLLAFHSLRFFCTFSLIFFSPVLYLNYPPVGNSVAALSCVGCLLTKAAKKISY